MGLWLPEKKTAFLAWTTSSERTYFSGNILVYKPMTVLSSKTWIYFGHLKKLTLLSISGNPFFLFYYTLKSPTYLTCLAIILKILYMNIHPSILPSLHTYMLFVPEHIHSVRSLEPIGISITVPKYVQPETKDLIVSQYFLK